MSIERKVVYWEKGGKEHTEETLKMALEASKERDIDTILVSSTTGYTAEKAVELYGDKVNIVVVTHSTGYRSKGVQMLTDETRAKLIGAGCKVVTCTDVLTGAVGVGVGRQRPGKTDPQEGRLPWIVPPPNIIVANTLRMFSQGVKVCAEIAMMAVDCNVIPSGKKVVAVAGSHSGADTAMVLDAAESSRIRDVKLREIICKPL